MLKIINISFCHNLLKLYNFLFFYSSVINDETCQNNEKSETESSDGDNDENDVETNENNELSKI